MSYTKGQRVRHVHGKLVGTVAQDAPDHAVVRVMWDSEDILRDYLPECIMPLDQQQVTNASVRDAWTRPEKARTK